MFNIKAVSAVVAGIAAIGLLGGCRYGMMTTYLYENGDKYTAGDREITDKIDTIDLDYTTGDVTLTESASDKIVITETARKELEDKQKVHTWIEGTTLHIRFCASAKKLDMTNLDKKLRIEIPSGLKFADINFKLVTGDINASCSADNIKLHTTTGDVVLYQKGDSKLVDVDTTTGLAKVEVENADTLSVNVTSGDVSVSAANVKELSSKTTTGESDYTFTQVPAATTLKATSGSIVIYLPQEADLTADIKATTGEISYEQAFAKNGNSYVCGSGANQLSAHTTTGDVILKSIAN